MSHAGHTLGTRALRDSPDCSQKWGSKTRRFDQGERLITIGHMADTWRTAESVRPPSRPLGAGGRSASPRSSVRHRPQGAGPTTIRRRTVRARCSWPAHLAIVTRSPCISTSVATSTILDKHPGQQLGVLVEDGECDDEERVKINCPDQLPRSRAQFSSRSTAGDGDGDSAA